MAYIDFHLLDHIDGLVQERCNSSALAMELRLSCTNPSIYNVMQSVMLCEIKWHDFFNQLYKVLWQKYLYQDSENIKALTNDQYVVNNIQMYFLGSIYFDLCFIESCF